MLMAIPHQNADRVTSGGGDSLQIMNRRSLFTWATLPLLLGCGSVEAQEGDPAAFNQTVDVRVVNIDLYVTDKKGRPVTDLGPDDFVLLVDGREVDFEYFSSASTGSRSLAKRGLDDVEGDDAKSVVVPADDLLLVIYFDGYWLTPQDRSRVLDDIAGFVKAQANAGLRFVVVSHGPPLEVLAPPTRDSEAVLEAISAMSDEPARGLERARARRSAYDSIRGIWEIYTDVPVQLGCGGPCECAGGKCSVFGRSTPRMPAIESGSPTPECGSSSRC